MAMARLALGEHGSGGNIEGGKQCRGAVADIIVGDAFDIAESHRQHRLGAIERLNLALLIDRQHNRVVGRVQVEADHIAHLFDEEGVGGELETLAAVRLQRKELKDPVDGGLGQAVDLCGQTNAPVSCSGGLLLERAAQQHGHLFVGDRARTARAKFVVEALQTILDEALPPLAHRRLRPA